MDETQDHIKEFDPNKPPEAEPVKLEPPARTPSMVLAELFRAIVSHLGNHPHLDALLTEYEAMTKGPAITEAPASTEEPIT